ncbi:von Willebrand factor A domain-containing protein 7-like [Mustelus asterias]
MAGFYLSAFGPAYKTSDPDRFIKWLELLEADGGGDIPEMSLSAVQLAVTNTPPLSDIYVFTDAPAKDGDLKGTILALIEQTKCKVSFLLTNAVTRRRRYAGDRFGNDLYRELAQASGGLAVVIQREFIAQLTSIIEDTTTTALVTVLQRQNNPEYSSNSFAFPVDSTLENITIYISGRLGRFYLTNPTGVHQLSSVSSGDLASVDRLGDLIVIRLHSPLAPGAWDLVVTSGIPYSVKVTGQSVVDFMYDFIEPIKGPHPGFAVLPGRPMAGMESAMEITVTGLPQYPSLRLRNLTLLNTQGVILRQQPLKPTSSPDTFLVEFQTLPEVGFYVQLRGEGENGAKFLRQSPTISRTSKTRVKVTADPSVKAGSSAHVSFTVTNTGNPAHYQIRITDDQNLVKSQPVTVFIDTNQSTERKSIISVPKETEPGTVVTLTVQATAGNELSYSILELTVVSQEENLTPPTCDILSRSTECPEGPPEQCGLQNWTLSVRFLSNSTAPLSIFARRGNGTMAREVTQGGGQTVTRVTYSSSCCFPGVELVGVDWLGNVGKCSSEIPNGGPGLAISGAAVVLAAAITATLLC